MSAPVEFRLHLADPYELDLESRAECSCFEGLLFKTDDSLLQCRE